MKSISLVSLFLFVDVGLFAGIIAVISVGMFNTPHTTLAESQLVLGNMTQHYPSLFPTPTIETVPIVISTSDDELNTAIGKQLELVYEKPNERRSYIISTKQVLSVYNKVSTINVEYIILDDRMLLTLVNDIGDYYSRDSSYEFAGRTFTSVDRSLDRQKLMHLLTNEFLSRLEGKGRTLLNITDKAVNSPATDGTLANKYLEVDKSQQVVYQWEGGVVVGSPVISTGLSGPTPNGTYYIKNHFENAWSPVANVWTPYLMAFAYNFDAKAWLGFHELPYWDGPHGAKIRRSIDTLGKPVTGGCIQLNIGDAKQVYDWAEDGMLLLIHD